VAERFKAEVLKTSEGDESSVGSNPTPSAMPSGQTPTHYSQQARRIQERVHQAFSDTYLTLLSIIQGTALVALFGKVDSLIGNHAFHAPEIVIATQMFFVIALTWYQYQVGLMLFTWTPQLVDALIPFGLGVCEFVAILGLEHGIIVTLVTLGVFFAIGMLAFENQYAQLRATPDDGGFIDYLVRGFRVRDQLSCAISGLVLFATAAIYAQSQRTQADAIAAGCVMLLISAAQALRLTSTWQLAQRRLRELNPE